MSVRLIPWVFSCDTSCMRINVCTTRTTCSGSSKTQSRFVV